MGCCLTTAVNHQHPPRSKLQPPPPPPYEQETVKEVLSETPIIPKPQSPLTTHNPPIPNGAVNLPENSTVEAQETVSEISEMYSYSESFSAATTATTTATVSDGKQNKIEVDEDGEVTQKVNGKSPQAKTLVRKRSMITSSEFPARNKRGARQVARRHVAPSPDTRRQSPARTTTNTSRFRNVGPSNECRREGTDRRSRSPAVPLEEFQQRKVGEKSLGEVLPVESKGKSTLEKTDDGGVSPLPEMEAEVQMSESLENPLVSLECFIFL